MTPCPLRRGVAKMASSGAKSQGVEQEFVEGLLLPGRTHPVMETLPNVDGWATEFRDTPRAPVQRAGNTLCTVNEPAGQGSGEGEEHHAGNLDVNVQAMACATNQRDRGVRESQIEDHGRDFRGPVLQSGKSLLNLARGPKVAVGYVVRRSQGHRGSSSIPCDQIHEPEPGGRSGASRIRDRKAKGVLWCPVRDVE